MRCQQILGTQFPNRNYVNGDFLNKNEDEAKVYFDWLTENYPQQEQQEADSTKNPKSVMQFKVEDELAEHHKHLGRKVEVMEMQRANSIKPILKEELGGGYGDQGVDVHVYYESAPVDIHVASKWL